VSSEFAIYLLAIAGSAAFSLLLPHLSPRRLWFGITVAPDFRNTGAARAGLRRYIFWVAAGSILAVVQAVLWEKWRGLAIATPLLAGVAAFLWEREGIRGIVPGQSLIMRADVAAEDRIPRWVALAIIPFAVPMLAANWLAMHWNSIPRRFPVHWNVAGVPNRWADKSPRTVYSPLVYGGALMLFVLFMAVASFYWSRRTPQRLAMLKLLVASVYLIAMMFTAISLMPVAQVPPLWLFAPTLAALAFLLWRMLRMAKLDSGTTPDRAWILGLIYFNPQDAAVFVPKRIGSGYTFNLGNRMSWILVAATVAAFVGLTWLWPR